MDIIASATFIPTHRHPKLGPVNIGPEGMADVHGLVATPEVRIRVDDDGSEARVPTGNLIGERGYLVSGHTPVKQVAGFGYGGGLDVDNKAREEVSAGRIVILRDGWGEVYQ